MNMDRTALIDRNGNAQVGMQADTQAGAQAGSPAEASPRLNRKGYRAAFDRIGLNHRVAVVGLGFALLAGTPVLALASEGAATPAQDSSVSATATESAATTSDAVASDATAASTSDDAEEAAVEIVLSDSGILVDGEAAATEQDAASETAGVYAANDVVYYEDRDTYDSGNLYGEGEADERHTAEEAAAVTVLHITEPGTYRLSGTLSNGQIAIDLGEDASDDPDAVVTLILDGVDVSNSVAPAVVFYNVYECDGDWSTETATSSVDTSAAGANVVIADGTVNNVTGSHVARIYKDNDKQKKLWKMDGAFYSFMSMNIDGEDEGTGVLNITADNEGLDTELHLTINGGNVNIFSNDDGINTNEDGVSVTTINGGSVHILAGLGDEGDGVDSNGWLVINGGTVVAAANPASDSGLDSDMGSYINGGTVVALGSTMDWAESESGQVTMNLQFASSKSAGDAIVLTDAEGNVVFAFDPSEDEVAGERIRSYTGAIVSCANLEVGQSYQLYIGGVVTGEEVQGVYDVSTVTDYTDGTLQSYTGTDVTSFPGGFGGFGGPMGGGFGGPNDNGGPDGSEAPDENGKPDGNGGPGMPDGDSGQGGPGENGGEPPEMPEGMQPGKGGQPGGDGENGGPGENGDRPEMPEGMGEPGDRGDEGTSTNSADANTLFYAQDMVNCFSGIANAAE